MDDGQGRSRARPALGRNHRTPRQGPRRAVRSTHQRTGQAIHQSHRSRRHSSTEIQAGQAVAGLDARELAGEKIDAVIDKAPGNGAAIGGIKVSAKSGWFAARPSGTEAIYKIYAESFKSEEHLQKLLTEAQTIVDAALA